MCELATSSQRIQGIEALEVPGSVGPGLPLRLKKSPLIYRA